MNTPQLYILDDHDQPCAKLLVHRMSDGTFRYCHPQMRNVKQYHGMTPTSPTPIQDFGVYIKYEKGTIYGELQQPSIATYRDGKPRRWQGEQSFQFNYIKPRQKKP